MSRRFVFRRSFFYRRSILSAESFPGPVLATMKTTAAARTSAGNAAVSAIPSQLNDIHIGIHPTFHPSGACILQAPDSGLSV
ncbi:MAG: hypothetical protein IKS19_07290 [Clostridia bacterium]|nr:hypothetical protein [Clostridia bacterium]